MTRIRSLLSKPVITLGLILPLALLAEFGVLGGTIGISLPSDRGSAVSSYEIRESVRDLHFITRNKRFSIVDLTSSKVNGIQTLILRESFVEDRRAGAEGAPDSSVSVEASDGDKRRWSISEPGQLGAPLGRLYVVKKLGCCDAPPTFTYFSMYTGRKILSTHAEVTGNQLGTLEESVVDE